MTNRLALAALALSLALAAGCSPRIGDSCSDSTNCSINNDRLCDQSQPGGACIVFNCLPNSCPDGAVCARFRSDEPRLAVVACMRGCASDSDCRTGEGYHCVGEADPGIAELGVSIVDTDSNRRFCIASLPE